MIERDELVQGIGDLSNHNPFPEAVDIADGLLELGWRRVSADEDTVERVAKALLRSVDNDSEEMWPTVARGYRQHARAALNAIGGGNAD